MLCCTVRLAMRALAPPACFQRASMSRWGLFSSSPMWLAPKGTSTTSAPKPLRLHGTITAYKHRRGFGFVHAEGYVGSDGATNTSETEQAPLSTYFFPRASMDGGFYVTEGERVSFEVSTQSSAPAFRRLNGAAPQLPAAAAEATERNGDGSHREKAVRLRHYDILTHAERPIVPAMLSGKVSAWNAAKNHGIISELDVHGNVNADAPTFDFGLDDCDLGNAGMFVGRYVRFALVPAGESAATTTPPKVAVVRVIVDKSRERRLGAIGVPVAPSSCPTGSVTATTRFFGTVREIREGSHFGFIQDESTGGSVFFHFSNMSNVQRANIREGCYVSYLLREIAHGRHAGKMMCVDICKETGRAAGSTNSGNSSSKSSLLIDDDEEFDLMD